MRLKLLKKQGQAKNKLRIVYAFTTDTDWQGLPSKSSQNSVQEKVNYQFI